MAFKVIILSAFIAVVSCDPLGAASYAISAPSGDHQFVGSSNEHTVKGLYGQNGHSSYSKAVDSAHSSVRVSRVSSTNDGIVKAVGPAYHAPIAAYHGPAAFGSPYHYGGHYAAPAVKVAAPFGHGYPYAAPYAHGPIHAGFPGAYHHGAYPGLGYKAPVAAIGGVHFAGLGHSYSY